MQAWTRLGSLAPLFEEIVEPDDVPAQEHDCPGVGSRQSQVVDPLLDSADMQAGAAIAKSVQNSQKAFIGRKGSRTPRATTGMVTGRAEVFMYPTPSSMP